MTTILLIADLPRLQNLFAFVQPIDGVRLRLASDLSQGEHELAAEPPAFVFMQSRLSGLSGEIIARHIRSRLASAKTQIIVFSLDPLDAAAAAKYADASLDLGENDESLTAAIREIVAGRPSLKQDSSLSSVPPAPVQRPVQLPQPPPIKDLDNNELRASLDIGIAKEPEDTARTEISTEAPAKSRFQGELETKLQTGRATDLRTFEENITNNPSRPIPAQQISSDKQASDSLGRRLSPKTRRWICAILTVVIIGSIFAVFSTKKTARRHETPAAPSRTSPSSTAPAVINSRLPSFVLSAKHDNSYKAAHPGWERYFTDTMEYKIYREKSAVKALQVIGRRTAAVPAQLFDRVLMEVAGARNYRLESKTEKGDYLIEKGTVQPSTKIIIYRRKPDLLLNAFVIYLP